ncbi:MAG: hypothetical protein V5A68_04205 [Candidatus Thermoplasmatota archaeon]
MESIVFKTSSDVFSLKGKPRHLCRGWLYIRGSFEYYLLKKN